MRTHLSEGFTVGEIRAFTTLILKEVCNLSFSDIVACKFTELSDNEKQNIISIVKRLQKGEPIQYILGVTEFYGLDLKVTSSVLIPRPETEELVEWILLETKQLNPHILDIGTGSGCIAITLSKKMKYATVDAWDVSAEALEVAKENAKANNVSIKFSKVDVLAKQDLDKRFDIIVSNPPYIIESEKKVMSKNVLDFEPHQALFVSNNDALIFYDRIADIAVKLLNKNGMLYFEINQAYGQQIVQLLQQKNFINIELKKDISGNYRMIRAMKE
ncbi:MAG: peptide chain release factor N(5)-glutamine methyltransferase [Bacteroidales bacterium]|nr:peptide chain release factor N(5)-glutamine methyltransferase [Bacteroidales bacterium]